MDKLDTLYQAFKKYRTYTKDDKLLIKERKPIEAIDKADLFVVSKYLCHIDEIWLKEIENGLPFIEKAIAEERQFIRTDSEVVDIEKVKRVGRESVEHLAKHSDLITREPKEDDFLVPDKILMVEKDSDYAVYENRFLYMLLCYLRDFISLRYQKITELLASYEAEFKLERKITSDKEDYEFKTYFKAKIKNNPYPLVDDSLKSLLTRIRNSEQLVNALLNRPLIVEVAKSPLIKPPIVKTNVLKNNNNFKKAVALYEFVANYNVAGFTSEEVKHDLLPLEKNKTSELAELYSLTSFLTYSYGNALDSQLEANYLEEEKRKAKLKEEEELKQIKRLKQKILEEGSDPYTYLVMLEKRNNYLEERLIEVPILEKNIKEQQEKIINLETEKTELLRQNKDLETNLEQTISSYQNTINEINIKYADEINNLKEEYSLEKSNLVDSYEANIAALNSDVASLDAQVNDLTANYESYKEKLDLEKENYKNKLDKDYQSLKANLEDNIAKRQDELNSYNESLKTKETNLEELETLRKAEYEALMIEQKKLTTDYTTKEKFNELEDTFMRLGDFFVANWQKTKKEIRKRILWAKKQSKRSDK